MFTVFLRRPCWDATGTQEILLEITPFNRRLRRETLTFLEGAPLHVQSVPRFVELAGRRVKKVDDRFNISRVNKKRFTTMVRVGSVFGSSGSVIPLFHKQIKFGGPLTVTHPKITRYFMTIPEAAQLVVQTGSMGQGGDVFVLDMGDLVEIIELAEKMIHLSGLRVHSDKNPHGDIAIEFTGLRPGELVNWIYQQRRLEP